MATAANPSLSGRQEHRIASKLVVEITDRQAEVFERTFTENVSDHGARIASRWHWSAGEVVLVGLHPGEPRTLARTVYCEPLPGDAYAIGVQFLESPAGWWKERML